MKQKIILTDSIKKSVTFGAFISITITLLRFSLKDTPLGLSIMQRMLIEIAILWAAAALVGYVILYYIHYCKHCHELWVRQNYENDNISENIKEFRIFFSIKIISRKIVQKYECTACKRKDQIVANKYTISLGDH